MAKLFGLFTLLLGGMAWSAGAATMDWSGTAGGNAWGTSSNWTGGTAPTSTDLARFDQTSYTNQPTVNSTSSSQGLLIGDGTTTTAALTVTAADALIIGASGITMFANAGTATLTGAGGIALGASQTWTNNSANLLTVSAPISGSGNLTKAGTGTLVLSGANSYTGTTTVSPGGTLSISADTNLGAAPATPTAGSLVIDSTGVLATTASFTLNANRGIKIGPTSGSGSGILDVAAGTTLTYDGIITSNGDSGTGGLTKDGAGVLILSGVNSYTGNSWVKTGTLTLGNAAAIPSGAGKGNLAVDGTLDLNGNSITVNGLSGTGTAKSGITGPVTLTAGGNNATSTFNGRLQDGSDTLALTKIGTGTLTLSGTNSFTGGVIINGGALQLSSTGALNSAAPNSVTFGANVLTGTKLQLNGNSVTLSGLTTNAAPGSAVVENANAAAATLTLNNAGANTFAGVLQDGTGGGALALTKTGAGTLTLSGANTYSGNTTISAGTLQIGNLLAMPSGTGKGNLAIAAGSFLDLNKNNVTVNGLSGAGTVTSGVAGAATLTVGGNDQTSSFGGVIQNGSGTVSLAKTGTGTLTLTAVSTYTGATAIKNGTLTLGIANALPTATTLTLGDGTTNSSGVLQLNGFTQTLAGLTTAGSGTANRIINGSATTVNLTLSSTANSSFGGILGGPGSNEDNFNLIKSGAGTLTLSGSNRYTGTTTINQGALSVANLASGGNLGTALSAVILGDASNTGTLSYTGNGDTFTRGLTVSAGGGGLDTATAGGTLTIGTGNVATAGAFTVGGAGNTAITSAITGTGSLNKTGTGTLTLSGVNTYSGVTTIKNGTVALGINDTGLKSTTTLTLGDAAASTNGVLKLNGYTQTLAGLLTAGNGTGNRVVGGSAALSTLTLNNSGANSFAGILGGTGGNENNLALVKTGAGVLTLSGANTYLGGTTISAGTLAVSAANNLGATSGALSLGAGTLQVTTSLTSARAITLTDTASAISVSSGVIYTNSGALTGTGALNLTAPGTLLVSGAANNYSGGTYVKNGVLMLGRANALPTATAVTLGSGSTGATLALNGNSQTVADLIRSGTGTSRVVNGKSTSAILTITNTGDAAFTGILGGSGSNENVFGLTKSGAGTLTLSGVNTYTGATAIAAGTLALSGGSAIADTSAVSLANDATAILLLNANETIGSLAGGGATGGNVTLQSFTLTAGGDNSTTSYGGVMSGAGAFTKAGTGTLTLTGANSYTGTTTINGGTLAVSGGTAIADTSALSLANTSGVALLLNANETIGSLAGGGTTGGNVNVQSYTLSAGANNADTSYGGVISGTGAFTKTGTGALTLTRASSYSGDTTIANGTIILGTNNALPSGTDKGNVIVNGALDLNGRTGSNATLNGLTGSGIVTNNNATTAILTLGGNNTTSTFTGAIQDGTGLVTLVKTGTGTLTLTPGTNNAFTGGVTINNGVVQAGNNNALNSAGTNVVTFASSAAVGTKLQVNGNAITIGGLASGTTTGSPVVENANATAGTLTLNNSAAYTYAGVIQDGTGGGALSLIKSGASTQTLSGTNTYNGSTTITAGTLSIRADANLGAAPATATAGQLIVNGGTLQSTTNSYSLSANRGIALGPASGSGSGTFEIVSSAGAILTTTYGGIIANNGSGTGGLVKTGLGNLALAGTANSYAGGTTINAGLLSVTTTAAGTPLGANVNTNTITVNAGGNLSLSATSNRGSNQTITVTSDASGRGGIGFSNTALSQEDLNSAATFTNNTGTYGGVLGINSGITYATALNLNTFGSGDNQGKWFLGSASSGTYSPTTLTVGADNLYRLGGGGGALTISGANALTGNTSLQVGFSGNNGNGMLTLSSSQSYTGITTVTGGAVLAVSADNRLGTGSGAGNIVLDGGTLRAASTFTLDSARGIAVGSATGSATGSIDTNNTAVLTYGGVMTDNGSGADSLTKLGSGTLILTSSSINTFTGAANLNAGTLNFARLENLGNGSAINFNGGTLQYSASDVADITARTVTTTGSTGAIIDTNGYNVTFAAGAITGTGALAKTGAGTLTLAVTNSYSGNTTITAGTVKLGTATAIPSGTGNGATTVTGTLDLNNFSPTLNLLTGAGTVTNTGTGAVTLTVDTANSSNGSTFSGALNNGSGTVSLNKIGANTLILSGTSTYSGASTYSGGTTISAGGITVASDAVLGAVPGTAAAGNIVITGGATLGASATMTLNANRGLAIGPSGTAAATIAPATGTTLTYKGIIANSGTATGGLTKSNTTGTLVLGGANTYAGNTTISGGTLQVADAAAIPSGPGKGNVSVAATNSGRLDLNGYAITVNGLTGAGTITSGVAGAAAITAGGNDQTSSFTGVIQNGSGTVSLGKTGSGTLTLAGANTYTGGTTISQGTLSISSDGNLGAVPASATPGNLVINGGTLSTSATLTINSKRGIAVGPASGSGTGTIDAAAGTTLTYGGIIADNGSGTGGLTKSNTTGTLVLGGANTYSGDTTVSGGTLQLGNVAAIPSGTGKGNLALAAGSTLDLNNLSPTVNGLSGAGTVTNGLTGSVTFTAGAYSQTGTFGGLIQDGNGTVAFTKTGSGTLTLTSSNSYSGNTTIDAGGTLEIANAAALPSGVGKGNVIVNGALDLDASLTINGLSGSGAVSTDTAGSVTLTAGGNDQSSTFDGSLRNGAGTVGLTKTGTGTLTLSGSNTYSGATTINAGTLAMGSATGLSANSTLTINATGTLDVNGFNVTMDGLLGTGTINNNGTANATLTAGAAGNSTSFGGVIADGSKTLSLTKSGSGTLTLTGINSYSGTTTIADGTLSVANPGTGGNLGTASTPIVLGDATHKGTLVYTSSADLSYTRGFTVNAGGGEMDVTAAGKTLTLQTGEIVTAGTFTVGGAGNAIVQSLISGSGGLTKTNTGSMVLVAANTYAGDTTIAVGTLQLGNVAAIPSGTGKGNLAIASGATLDVYNLSPTVNGLSGAGTVTNSLGSPVTFTVGDNDASSDFGGVLQDGSGTLSLTKIGSGTQTLSGANTYSGDTTVSTGTLRIGHAAALPSGVGKGNVAVAGAGILDLNDFDITLNGLSGAGLITNHAGASMLTAGANNQTSAFAGNIQDGTGTIGLTKTGAGTLTLSGSNTFSGATTIAQGTLSMGSDTGLSPHSTLTVDNAGALDLNGHTIAIDGLAGTGSITNNSATPVTLTTGASGGSGTFGGTLDDGTGVIALVKTGAGTVTLTHVNSYSGGTTVTGGLLAITSYGALGAIPAAPTPGNLVINGGGISATNTFEINANRGIAVGPAAGSGSGILDAALNQTLTYNGIIANNGSGTGGLEKTGLGTVTLGGINTYSGDTTISAGAMQIGNALAVPSGAGKGNLILAAGGTVDLNNTSITVNGLSGTGTVSNTKTGLATLTAGANHQSSTFDGLLEDGNGTTALLKTGTGILTLTGTNTYTGTTTIEQGTLSISQDVNLGTALLTATPGSLVINADATLAATDTFTLNANRGIAVGPAGAGIIDVAPTKTLTYGGSIANNGGAGGFTKTGTGTLVLSGTSSYTGTTTVEAGVLTVNGSIAGSGATVVKTGATLTGIGTTGAMTVDSNGTLSPGNNGIGTLGVSGLLTLTGNADFALGTPGANHANPGISDRVEVTGDILLGGNLNVSDNAGLNGQGSVGAGSYKLFTYTGSTSGQFDTVSGLPSYHWALHDVTADKAIYVDMYNYAVATVTPAVDLGRIHAGGDFGTQALTVGNTAPADASFTETLAGVFGTPTTGITATGSVTGIAGQGSNSSGMIVGISDNTAGQKTGSVTVGFTSQAVSGSGLSDTALAAQSVGVTGFAYTGQSSWINTGSGSWGNNVNAFGNWDLAGGVPGLDGALSINDTATFGDAISAPATVRLDGASPSLSAVTFNHASQAYTLAQGSGGTLILKGNGGPATVTVANGSHTMSTPLNLATNAAVTVANAGDTLTVSGPVAGSGYGITKDGEGTLALTGDSSYTGRTDVTLGTLKVNGSIASAVKVDSRGILAGTGATGAVTLENGGTLAPGDSTVNYGIGIITATGNSAWKTGAVYEWQLGQVDPLLVLQPVGTNPTANYDQFNLASGVLAISDGFEFKIASGDTTPTGWDPSKDYEWIVAKTGGTITNAAGGALNPGAIALDASGVKWGDPANFYFTLGGANNSELVLNYRSVIPEPGMLGLLALAAAALATRRRN
jgi:autotransporter-associated beta strand protein